MQPIRLGAGTRTIMKPSYWGPLTTFYWCDWKQPARTTDKTSVDRSHLWGQKLNIQACETLLWCSKIPGLVIHHKNHSCHQERLLTCHETSKWADQTIWPWSIFLNLHCASISPSEHKSTYLINLLWNLIGIKMYN